MKQFQFVYSGEKALTNELQKIRQWCRNRPTSAIFFTIYAATTDSILIGKVCGLIDQVLPDALYMGCSTNASIREGSLIADSIVICCTVCEYATTQAKVLQYELTAETVPDVKKALLAEIAANPWVKSIEMLVTIRGMSMEPFCDALSELRPDIMIFGGGAFNPVLDFDLACVFSNAGSYSTHGVVFTLLGGEDLYLKTTFITGWKPLGMPFRVTRAEGSLLLELDGSPAYEVYYRYLNIKNDEHFFINSLEFPFFYEHHGIDILRAPTRSNPDGSITMTADMDENVTAHLAYGDPLTILDSVREEGYKFSEFQPEMIRVYSCGARRTFWGDKDISKETNPFAQIAPTSGFYTSGEFLRTGTVLHQHNVTMVVAALREGNATGEAATLSLEHSDDSGKVSLITRLAQFIDAATAELEEANQKLAHMAVSDAMTGLYNRGEIQRRITERLLSGRPLTLVMMDLDNFKQVNDTYGHAVGDCVIRGLCDLLKQGLAQHHPDGCAGRWGGEEFMVMLPDALDEGERTAAEILKDFAAIDFPWAGHKTVSLGVTEAIPGESADALLIRVDQALYQAKKNGKNQYVVL